MWTKNEFAEVMAKHLPPSASELRLLDIGGVIGELLLEYRPDLLIELASLDITQWDYPANSFDAIVGYDILLKPALLKSSLSCLRAGGRLIIINPLGDVDEKLVISLEDENYIRILVEPALPDGIGVLVRGEKEHTTADTVQRVNQVAQRDTDLIDINTFRGRYVRLLVVQSPNKPVWKLTSDEIITWEAVAIIKESSSYLLVFSSLPKAVNFMQAAVMQGFVDGINKMGKFSKAVANNWQYPVLLNPTLDSVKSYPIQWITIDPNTAEAPEE